MHPKKKILMPPTFAPHHFSVVIGKGRDARDAPGTKILRSEIFNKLAVYRKCSRRLEKAQIVSDLLREQQRRCPGGGAFVKHDGERWWELSEHDARENITAAFRNRLHENYTSSSKFKSAKRRMQLKTNGDVPRRETVVSVIKHIEPEEESKCKISPIKSLSSNDTIREEKVTLLPAVSVEDEIWNQHALNILRACMLRTNDIEHAADMQSSSCKAINDEHCVQNQDHDERILTSTTSSSDHSCTTLLLSTKVNNPNDWVSRMVSSSECEEDNHSSMDSPPISFSPGAKITCMSSDDAMESWCKHVRMEPQHLMNNQSFASMQTSWDCYSPSAVSSRRDDFFVAALTNSRRFSWLFRADPIMFSQEEELLEPVDPTMFDERLTTIH